MKNIVQRGDKIVVKTVTFTVVSVKGQWVALSFENGGITHIRFVKLNKISPILKVG